jgi:hypothetical protein
MRLPGTRYQEHGWEQVRKLLGECSLQALDPALLARACDPATAQDALSEYVDALCAALHAHTRRARGEAPGNSYGDSVAELALALACELRARQADWHAFAAALGAEQARSGAFWTRADAAGMLRKKVNDMYTVLRDKVDSDNYQVACGRPCSANRMYAYRMLDMAYADIARLFANWESNREQVGAILGRNIGAMPIEVRMLTGIGACKAEWIERWSASLERFGDGPGPLHTRSKRFEGLKGHPDKIQAMLAEIGEYEALSANQDRDWLQDADDAAVWLDDLARVLAAPLPADGELPHDCEADDGDTMAAVATEAEQRRAAALALPPGYAGMARTGHARGSWMDRRLPGLSAPVRLAVYLKLLGPADDSYPADWLDPATGELPTMQQLAALEGVSLPTLRKRRDEAIARLSAPGEE